MDQWIHHLDHPINWSAQPTHAPPNVCTTDPRVPHVDPRTPHVDLRPGTSHASIEPTRPQLSWHSPDRADRPYTSHKPVQLSHFSWFAQPFW
jgi:hypothetical protein